MQQLTWRYELVLNVVQAVTGQRPRMSADANLVQVAGGQQAVMQTTCVHAAAHAQHTRGSRLTCRRLPCSRPPSAAHTKLQISIHTVMQAVMGGTKRKRTDASSDFKAEFQRSLRNLSYLAEDLVNYYYPQKMAAFFKSTGVDFTR